MKRKDFIKQTFYYGIGSCLGMQLLSNGYAFAGIKSVNPETDDDFLKYFDWLKDVFNTDLTSYFAAETVEYEILTELKKGWGIKNTVELFKELTAKYEEKAAETMKQFIKKTTIPYWTGRGEKEAKTGTEVENFIHALWDPMSDNFKYEKEINDGIYKFNVTQCPFAQLAEKTGMHEWVFNMACITDYYMTPAFSKEIGFSRTKTMVQGDEKCNHTYYYKSKKTKKDALLGNCGLYCGGCLAYQNTKSYEPIDYKKEKKYETCEGCNSGFVANWCAQCKIKECAKSKNIRVCIDCDEFPCDKMTSFIDNEKYPYHKEVEAKMKRYKEIGLEKWLAEQEKEYICKSCGKIYNFFQKTCEACGTKL